MQPLKICIGPTIRIGRESWCLPYAGFLLDWLELGNLEIGKNPAGYKDFFKIKM